MSRPYISPIFDTQIVAKSTKLFSDKYQSNLADIYVREDRGSGPPTPEVRSTPLPRPFFPPYLLSR